MNNKLDLSKNKKKFFLGIGAQKAGTTWLMANLEKHPQISSAPIKELHFFDRFGKSITAFSFSFWTRKLFPAVVRRKRIIDAIINILLFRGQKKDWWIFKFYFLAQSTKNIPKYKRLLESLRTNDSIVGECTPAYSTLSLEVVKEIKATFPELKIFFLLRDPIEREWSAAKMILLRHRFKEKKDLDVKQVEKFIKKNHLKSNYIRTLNNWLACFDKDQFGIFFFDDLKKNKLNFLNSICSFLEVTSFEEIPDSRIPNKGFDIALTETIEKSLFFKMEADLIQLAEFFKDYPINYPQAWLEKYRAKYGSFLSSHSSL